MRISEEFFSQVVLDGDCWIWTGIAGPNGYGQFRINGRKVYTHRWSWEFFNGDIPEGLEMDHLCCVRACVNPQHLEPVTHGENMRRAVQRRTHCRNGHRYTQETETHKTVSGRLKRVCKVCERARAARRTVETSNLSGVRV